MVSPYKVMSGAGLPFSTPAGELRAKRSVELAHFEPQVKLTRDVAGTDEQFDALLFGRRERALGAQRGQEIAATFARCADERSQRLRRGGTIASADQCLDLEPQRSQPRVGRHAVRGLQELARAVG